MNGDGDRQDDGKSAGDFEVRYSERFTRERTRSNRRGLLFGGIGFLVAGIVIIHDALIAFGTGELVSMGRRVLPPLPAFLAAPLGVVFALIGVGLLWARIVQRDN